jgi:hypothetical protein
VILQPFQLGKTVFSTNQTPMHVPFWPLSPYNQTKNTIP